MSPLLSHPLLVTWSRAAIGCKTKPRPGAWAAGTLASFCKLSKNCHPNIHIISIQFLVEPLPGDQPISTYLLSYNVHLYKNIMLKL